MRRLLKLIHRKDFIATYSLALLVMLGISFLIYRGISRALERKPVTISLQGKMSDLRNGSIMFFDVAAPGPFFGFDSPFETANTMTVESPEMYLFEPADPAKLQLTAPILFDENLDDIPQYKLKEGEDSIVHVMATRPMRMQFSGLKSAHMIVGFPSDFSRGLGSTKQVMAFDFRVPDKPPLYRATLGAPEGTDATLVRQVTRPGTPGEGTYTLHAHFDPQGTQPTSLELNEPAPEPGVGLITAADLSSPDSSLALLLPVSMFITSRIEANLVLGQQRYKIETTDDLRVDNLRNGSLHIRTDGDLIELKGSGKDIILNGVPLVQREFERISAPLQGAIAGLLTTIAFSIGRVVITLASRTLQRTSRSE